MRIITHTFFLFCILSSFSFAAPMQAAIPCSEEIFSVPKNPNGLALLEQALASDLELINYPPSPWSIQYDSQTPNPILDVAIIGAGMAGITSGTALFKEGIGHIRLFDQSVKGKEGPWMTHARMRTLRSNKADMGLALGIPHLTFRAWFEALYGLEEWNILCRIPNHLWMDYLNWYREVMKLPVENECRLLSLTPLEGYFLLEFMQQEKKLEVKARKVVLATGREGFGGPNIPSGFQHLPKTFCKHVVEDIDFIALKDKRIGIIGGGSSAFDAAAVALEYGARNVDLMIRHPRLPSVNKLSCLPDQCLRLPYSTMSDHWRWKLMSQALAATIPPPIDSLKRVQDYPNFRLLPSMAFHSATISDDGTVALETNQGLLHYDFLILGTGYAVDGRQQPELRHVIDHIKLWQDILPAEELSSHPAFGRFPYLGRSFEFQEKIPGTLPSLKHLYCFNYGAILSNGLLSNDISSISDGAMRLAQGIAADFLFETGEAYLQKLENFQDEAFHQEDYFSDYQ